MNLRETLIRKEELILEGQPLRSRLLTAWQSLNTQQQERLVQLILSDPTKAASLLRHAIKQDINTEASATVDTLLASTTIPVATLLNYFNEE